MCYFAKRSCHECTEIPDALQYTEESTACIFSDSVLRKVSSSCNQSASFTARELPFSHAFKTLQLSVNYSSQRMILHKDGSP